MAISEGRRALGREIKRALSAAGLSVAAGARSMNVEPKRLYRWINAEVNPSIDDLERLAKAIGQPIAVRLGPGTTKRARPFDWDGLMDYVEAIAVAVDARVGETRAERLIRLAAEGIETPPAPDAAAGSGGQGPQSQAPPSGPTPRPGQ